MHFRGLDLNLLVALDALITERSISRTGEKIHLSQPATSGALARLREYFKDDLLVPVGRKMVLTPLAEELAEPVRQLLLQTDAIIHRNPAFTPMTSDRAFRLVMSDYVATTLMSRALPEIQRQAPRIKVQVLVPGTRTDWIERGEADLMIMPQQYLSPNHPSEPLFEDDFVCIAWAGNTGLREHSISLRDYLRLGHVVVRFGEQQEVPAFEEKFMEHFSQARRIEVVTTGFTLVPPLIIGTTRIATAAPEARRVFGETSATEDPATSGRDSFHGGIGAVAHRSRRGPRPSMDARTPQGLLRGGCFKLLYTASTNISVVQGPEFAP